MIVILNVLFDTRLKLIQIVKFVQVEKFRFQRAKKTLNSRVVVAVTLARHAGCDRILIEQSLVNRHPILPALVGMQNRLFMRSKPLKCSFKHFVDHGVQRAPGNRIGNDFAAVQIHDRRQIEFLASYFEFGHVGGPFLVKVLRFEITL
ncbi:hypothetical protein ALP89_200108 [Pseudomonas syringae pv. persicae]|nr:hypothetical protein ALP89_200108 [Pseudomonas syringae pv. persicae]